MKPATVQWLERMRINGKKPPVVFLEIDREQPSDWFAWRETWSIPVLSLASSVNVQRLDLRALIGLRVMVTADRYTPWLWSLWQAVKAAGPCYAALVIREWADHDGDFGWHWSIGTGDKLLTEALS